MFSMRIRANGAEVSAEVMNRAVEDFLGIIRETGSAVAADMERLLVQAGVRRGPSHQFAFRGVQKLRENGVIRFEDKRWVLVHPVNEMEEDGPEGP